MTALLSQHSPGNSLHHHGDEDLGLLSLLSSGSWLETLSCGSQAPSKEVVPSDLPATHILSLSHELKKLIRCTLALYDPRFYFISSSPRTMRTHVPKPSPTFITLTLNLSMMNVDLCTPTHITHWKTPLVSFDCPPIPLLELVSYSFWS